MRSDRNRKLTCECGKKFISNAYNQTRCEVCQAKVDRAKRREATARYQAKYYNHQDKSVANDLAVMTFAEIAEIEGISKEAIRQAETRHWLNCGGSRA